MNEAELKELFQNLYESNIDKRGFDRLTSGFIRKKRNTDVNSVMNRITKQRRKRSTDPALNTEYKNIDSEKTSSVETIEEVQKETATVKLPDKTKRKDEEFFSIHRDKKGFDRLTSGFVKKSNEEEQLDEKGTKSSIADIKTLEHSNSDIRNDDIDIEHVSAKEENDIDKRRLDRLTSGFVKKEDDKRRFDRLTSGFVKKDENKRYFGRFNSGLVKKNNDKRRGFDRLTSGFVKKDTDKRYFGRLNAGLVKKEDNKRRLDRLTSGFVKKNDDKRYFGRLNSGLVKKEDTKRRFDRLTSGFVKKESDKRGFDRLTSGFVKKDDNKRRFDRLTSGFVKKDNAKETDDWSDQDKRRFDRLTSGFVRRNDDDKRKLDRITSGFVKKENNKRRFDRLTSGFVKKDDDKRYFDRLNAGFVKKNDKRRLDRLTSGFVKKDDKRRFDRLTSGFVKKDDVKRRFDRLTSGFVKRQDKENEVEGPTSDLDGATNLDTNTRNGYQNGLNNDAAISSNILQDNDNTLPKTDKNIIEGGKYTNNLTEDKRRVDRLAYGFIKRTNSPIDFVPAVGIAQSELQKRYFGRLNSGLVKRDITFDPHFTKRRFDRLTSGFVKRPFSENEYMDEIDLDSLNKMGYNDLGPFINDIDASDYSGSYNGGLIDMSEAPLNRQKRSTYADGSGLFPLTGYSLSDNYGYGDISVGDRINGIERRRFDRLMSGLVKKARQAIINGQSYGQGNDVYSQIQSHLGEDRLNSDPL